MKKSVAIKYWRFMALAVVALILSAFFLLTSDGTPHQQSVIVETASGAQHRFTVDVADTVEKQRTGLMFREHMPQDHGMLFLFGVEGELSFWMKNTYIPLDMIFIGSDGRVKKVHADAVPHSLDRIGSGGPALGVLEINAGLAKELGITPGARILHPYFSE